jgi:hypothetical protein
MLDKINFVLNLGILILLLILTKRFEDVFKWFSPKELHRTLAGLQKRLTGLRKKNG